MRSSIFGIRLLGDVCIGHLIFSEERLKKKEGYSEEEKESSTREKREGFPSRGIFSDFS